MLTAHLRIKVKLMTFVTSLALGAFGQSPRAVPASYATTANTSYVRIWDAMAPETNPNTLITRPLRDVRQTTSYFDGLGRPLQTVAKQGSYPTGGSPVDLVSMIEYDQLGREQYKYLPTPANGTGTNLSISDGLFKLNPFAQQAAFYNSASSTSPLFGQSETFFYGQQFMRHHH